MGVTLDAAGRARAEAALQAALAGARCPEGARRVGAEPPEGREVWCERPGPDGTARRDGPYEAWHDNGVKAISGRYVDGEREGDWVLWHDNGQRHQEWHYTKGAPDGRFREWDAQGGAVADVVYDHGKPAGAR